MRREELKNRSLRVFDKIQTQINLNNQLGFFDINKICEDVFIPVFKKIFKADDLHNLNMDQDNYPSIDLGSPLHKIAIQVTTTKSSEKINHTHKKYIDHGLCQDYDQLYIFILGSKQKSYTLKYIDILERNGVIFEKAKHILDFSDLIKKIYNENIDTQHELISELEKEAATEDNSLTIISQKDVFQKNIENGLKQERKSGKFIEEIYREINPNKEFCRYFINPHLFYSKDKYDLDRIYLDHVNIFLEKCGIPYFNIEELKNKIGFKDFTEALNQQIEQLIPYKFKNIDSFNYQALNDPLIFIQSRFIIASYAENISDILKTIYTRRKLEEKKVFIITASAGKGKTNFICDLLKNYTIPHKITSIFITSRDIYFNHTQIEKALLTKTPKKFKNIEDFFETYQHVFSKKGKFLLITIDGLNEASDINYFAYELEKLIEKGLRYKGIKFLLTCRTEFYKERFLNLNRSSFSDLIYESELPHFWDDNTGDMLINGYFEYFNVNAEVSYNVHDTLLKDPLLLRIFCEAYRNTKYNPVQITSLNRHTLFKKYYETKMRDLGSCKITDCDIAPFCVKAISKIISRMVEEKKFEAVKYDHLESQEAKALDILISDEIFLKQTLSTDSFFSTIIDEVSFTFDEFRDFLIAEWFISKTNDPKFDINSQLEPFLDKKCPIFEGLSKFLYILGRNKNLTEIINKLESTPKFSAIWPTVITDVSPDKLTTADEEKIVAFLTHKLDPYPHPMYTTWLFRALYSNDDVFAANIITKSFTIITKEKRETAYRSIKSILSELHQQKPYEEFEKIIKKLPENYASKKILQNAVKHIQELY